jgi:hypothetical protein
MDIDDDGDLEVVYAWEGSSDGQGGVNILKYDGGDMTDSNNWTDTQIIQHNGAWRLWRGNLIDMTGDGNKDNIVFSARDMSNSSPDLGVFYLTKPSSGGVYQTWTKTKIGQAESNSDDINFCIGNYFGNNTGRDVALMSLGIGNLYLFDASNNWSKTTVDLTLTVDLDEKINSGWNVASIPNHSLHGHDSLVVFMTSDNYTNIVLLDYENGYRARIVKRYAFHHPNDDLMIPANLFHSNSSEILFINDGSSPNGSSNARNNTVNWMSFTKEKEKKSSGIKVELKEENHISPVTDENLTLSRIYMEGSKNYFQLVDSDKGIQIPEGVHGILVFANVTYVPDENNTYRDFVVKINNSRINKLSSTDSLTGSAFLNNTLSSGYVPCSEGDVVNLGITVHNGEVQVKNGTFSWIQVLPFNV